MRFDLIRVFEFCNQHLTETNALIAAFLVFFEESVHDNINHLRKNLHRFVLIDIRKGVSKLLDELVHRLAEAAKTCTYDNLVRDAFQDQTHHVLSLTGLRNTALQKLQRSLSVLFHDRFALKEVRLKLRLRVDHLYVRLGVGPI